MNPLSNHLPQYTIYKDPARFKVAPAGRRFGKTILGREFLVSGCQKRKSNYLYTATSYGHAKQLMWEKLKERFKQLGWKYDKNESELRIWRVLNQATVWLKSGNDPDKIIGDGYDGYVGDEFADTPLLTWTKAIRPSLSDKRGWGLLIGTPKGFNHFYDLWLEAKTTPGWAAFNYRTIDSPFFQTEEGRAEIEAARRDLDERTFRQEYEASFETFSGRICYAFDRSIHNSHHNYDPGLPIYIGQDFNRNPMSGVLFQKVAGRMIAFKEMILFSSSTEEMCNEVKRQFPRWREKGIIMRPDSTGSRLTTNTAKSDITIMKEHNFFVEAGSVNPRRQDRWAACNRAFERDLALVNVANCPKLTKELEKMTYKENTCEPLLTNEVQGHIWDAFGYNIYKEFPIIIKSEPRVYTY